MSAILRIPLPAGKHGSQIARVGLAVLLLLICISRTGWDHRRYAVLLVLFHGLALLLIGFAVLLRAWASLFIAGHKNSKLITLGPYALCRHPLYLASVLGALGAAMATMTLTIPAIVLLAALSLYPAIIRREEARLSHWYGPAFKAYCEQVPMVIPRWHPESLRHEPPLIEAVPQAFRRQLKGVTWFIFGLGAVEAIRTLQQFHDMPTLFKLY
jgi:protein-S-isoprenylcysteine O-methyltransferase Ste14